MRTIIIDDEYLAQEGLKMELAEFPEIEIVGQFADVQDFLEQASQLKPDLLFIDIEMPQMSGFDLINAVQADLPGQKPVIVLVTAYAQYAIQAFEASVTDYLLKPVTATRLKKTLARIVPVWQEKMRALIGTDPMTEEAEYASHTKPRQANTLTLHCFGPFTLSLGGKPLGFKWRSKKELELLAYLSCQRGHPVTKDKIADALWPELNSKRASANLYLTYHYLQQDFIHLSLELPMLSIRGMMSLNCSPEALDVFEFDRLNERIRKTTGMEKIQLMENVCNQFYQPLCDNLTSDWIMHLRRTCEIILDSYQVELARWYKDQDPVKSAYFTHQMDT